MNKYLVLVQRSIREALRTPEALLPTIFIPLFFLVVNVGQAAKIFPSTSTPFLAGQNYAAFQLPSALLRAPLAARVVEPELEGAGRRPVSPRRAGVQAALDRSHRQRRGEHHGDERERGEREHHRSAP